MRHDLSALNTSQLKRLADQLRSELREIEAELWRRTAVRLAMLPPGWADPPMDLASADERDDYLEDVHACLERQLPSSCRPGKTFPWTEIWGPVRALGANPAHRLRELVMRARDEMEERQEGREPWR